MGDEAIFSDTEFSEDEANIWAENTNHSRSAHAYHASALTMLDFDEGLGVDYDEEEIIEEVEEIVEEMEDEEYIDEEIFDEELFEEEEDLSDEQLLASLQTSFKQLVKRPSQTSAKLDPVEEERAPKHSPDKASRRSSVDQARNSMHSIDVSLDDSAAVEFDLGSFQEDKSESTLEEPEDYELSCRELIAVVHEGENVDADDMIQRCDLRILYKNLHQRHKHMVRKRQQEEANWEKFGDDTGAVFAGGPFHEQPAAANTSADGSTNNISGDDDDAWDDPWGFDQPPKSATINDLGDTAAPTLVPAEDEDIMDEDEDGPPTPTAANTTDAPTTVSMEEDEKEDDKKEEEGPEVIPWLLRNADDPEDFDDACLKLIAVIYKDDEEADFESMVRRTTAEDLYQYLKQQYWYLVHTGVLEEGALQSYSKEYDKQHGQQQVEKTNQASSSSLDHVSAHVVDRIKRVSQLSNVEADDGVEELYDDDINDSHHPVASMASPETAQQSSPAPSGGQIEVEKSYSQRGASVLSGTTGHSRQSMATDMTGFESNDKGASYSNFNSSASVSAGLASSAASGHSRASSSDFFEDNWPKNNQNDNDDDDGDDSSVDQSQVALLQATSSHNFGQLHDEDVDDESQSNDDQSENDTSDREKQPLSDSATPDKRPGEDPGGEEGDRKRLKQSNDVLETSEHSSEQSRKEEEDDDFSNSAQSDSGSQQGGYKQLENDTLSIDDTSLGNSGEKVDDQVAAAPEMSDIEKTDRMIKGELESILVEAESAELDQPMEPEAVEALKRAARKVSYTKKYYSVLDDNFVYLPSIAKTIIDYTLTDEAEKYYFDDDEEFPIEYTAALRAVASVRLENESENYEYIEKLAVGIDRQGLEDDNPDEPSMDPSPEPETPVADEEGKRIQKMIKEELDALIVEAEKDELEEPFEPEAVSALVIAAMKIGYTKKYFDDELQTDVYFPSIAKCMINYTLTEEAEKHYSHDGMEEFPIEYIAALREVALKHVENDDTDYEAMEKLAENVNHQSGEIAPYEAESSGRGREVTAQTDTGSRDVSQVADSNASVDNVHAADGDSMGRSRGSELNDADQSETDDQGPDEFPALRTAESIEEENRLKEMAQILEFKRRVDKAKLTEDAKALGDMRRQADERVAAEVKRIEEDRRAAELKLSEEASLLESKYEDDKAALADEFHELEVARTLGLEKLEKEASALEQKRQAEEDRLESEASRMEEKRLADAALSSQQYQALRGRLATARTNLDAEKKRFAEEERLEQERVNESLNESKGGLFGVFSRKKAPDLEKEKEKQERLMQQKLKEMEMEKEVQDLETEQEAMKEESRKLEKERAEYQSKLDREARSLEQSMFAAEEALAQRTNEFNVTIAEDQAKLMEKRRILEETRSEDQAWLNGEKVALLEKMRTAREALAREAQEQRNQQQQHEERINRSAMSLKEKWLKEEAALAREIEIFETTQNLRSAADIESPVERFSMNAVSKPVDSSTHEADAGMEATIQSEGVETVSEEAGGELEAREEAGSMAGEQTASIDDEETSINDGKNEEEPMIQAEEGATTAAEEQAGLEAGEMAKTQEDGQVRPAEEPERMMNSERVANAGAEEEASLRAEEAEKVRLEAIDKATSAITAGTESIPETETAAEAETTKSEIRTRAEAEDRGALKAEEDEEAMVKAKDDARLKPDEVAQIEAEDDAADKTGGEVSTETELEARPKGEEEAKLPVEAQPRHDAADETTTKKDKECEEETRFEANEEEVREPAEQGWPHDHAEGNEETRWVEEAEVEAEGESEADAGSSTEDASNSQEKEDATMIDEEDRSRADERNSVIFEEGRTKIQEEIVWRDEQEATTMGERGGSRGAEEQAEIKPAEQALQKAEDNAMEQDSPQEAGAESTTNGEQAAEKQALPKPAATAMPVPATENNTDRSIPIYTAEKEEDSSSLIEEDVLHPPSGSPPEKPMATGVWTPNEPNLERNSKSLTSFDVVRDGDTGDAPGEDLCRSVPEHLMSVHQPRVDTSDVASLGNEDVFDPPTAPPPKKRMLAAAMKAKEQIVERNSKSLTNFVSSDDSDMEVTPLRELSMSVPDHLMLVHQPLSDGCDAGSLGEEDVFEPRAPPPPKKPMVAAALKAKEQILERNSKSFADFGSANKDMKALYEELSNSVPEHLMSMNQPLDDDKDAGSLGEEDVFDPPAPPPPEKPLIAAALKAKEQIIASNSKSFANFGRSHDQEMKALYEEFSNSVPEHLMSVHQPRSDDNDAGSISEKDVFDPPAPSPAKKPMVAAALKAKEQIVEQNSKSLANFDAVRHQDTGAVADGFSRSVPDHLVAANQPREDDDAVSLAEVEVFDPPALPSPKKPLLAAARKTKEQINERESRSLSDLAATGALETDPSQEGLSKSSSHLPKSGSDRTPSRRKKKGVGIGNRLLLEAKQLRESGTMPSLGGSAGSFAQIDTPPEKSADPEAPQAAVQAAADDSGATSSDTHVADVEKDGHEAQDSTATKLQPNSPQKFKTDSTSEGNDKTSGAMLSPVQKARLALENRVEQARVASSQPQGARYSNPAGQARAAQWAKKADNKENANDSAPTPGETNTLRDLNPSNNLGRLAWWRMNGKKLVDAKRGRLSQGETELIETRKTFEEARHHKVADSTPNVLLAAEVKVEGTKPTSSQSTVEVVESVRSVKEARLSLERSAQGTPGEQSPTRQSSSEVPSQETLPAELPFQEKSGEQATTNSLITPSDSQAEEQPCITKSGIGEAQANGAKNAQTLNETRMRWWGENGKRLVDERRGLIPTISAGEQDKMHTDAEKDKQEGVVQDDQVDVESTSILLAEKRRKATEARQRALQIRNGNTVSFTSESGDLKKKESDLASKKEMLAEKRRQVIEARKRAAADPAAESSTQEQTSEIAPTTIEDGTRENHVPEAQPQERARSDEQSITTEATTVVASGRTSPGGESETTTSATTATTEGTVASGGRVASIAGRTENMTAEERMRRRLAESERLAERTARARQSRLAREKQLSLQTQQLLPSKDATPRKSLPGDLRSSTHSASSKSFSPPKQQQSSLIPHMVREADRLSGFICRYEHKLETLCKSLLAVAQQYESDGEAAAAAELPLTEMYKFVRGRDWYQRYAAGNSRPSMLFAGLKAEADRAQSRRDQALQSPSKGSQDEAPDGEKVYKITPVGEAFLKMDGPVEADVCRFLSSVHNKGEGQTKTSLEQNWRDIARLSGDVQSERVHEKLDELMKFCLDARFIE